MLCDYRLTAIKCPAVNSHFRAAEVELSELLSPLQYLKERAEW
jgi:hypothetical protein